MRLWEIITLHGGGPGSGCNPEVGKCGPHAHGGFPSDEANQKALNQEPKKPAKWRQFNPKRVAGYFREGTTIADMYKTLVAKEGEWHPINDFEQRHAGKANIGYRVQELKYTGKRSGLWTVEKSGDQVRIFRSNQQQQKQPQPVISDEKEALADDTAKQYIALQKKYGVSSVPRDQSVALFNKYFTAMGITPDARNKMESAVRGWTGTIHGDGGQLLRQVAISFYGRDPKNEWTDGASKAVGNPGFMQKASDVKDAVLALKAYTSAYARQHDVNVVYRGVNGAYADELRANFKNPSVGAIEVPLNSLSSWSVDKATAGAFGSATILKMKIDPDNVWAAKVATPWLFSAHSNENEFIIGSRMPTEKFKRDDVYMKTSIYGAKKFGEKVVMMPSIDDDELMGDWLHNNNWLKKDVQAGGPGSGCKGPNCGRKGSDNDSGILDKSGWVKDGKLYPLKNDHEMHDTAAIRNGLAGPHPRPNNKLVNDYDAVVKEAFQNGATRYQRIGPFVELEGWRKEDMRDALLRTPDSSTHVLVEWWYPKHDAQEFTNKDEAVNHMYASRSKIRR